MGLIWPKPQPPPPPPPSPSPPCPSRPWRMSPPLNSEYLSELKERVEKFSLPPRLDVTRANILILGPSKAGKSSFINTITSIFKDRMAESTTTGDADKNLTSRYKQHQVISLDNETVLNFCLHDTRGFVSNSAPYLTDLNYLLEGNVPDGYIFTEEPVNPGVPGFIHHPGIKDKVHCVVFVFDANKVKLTEECIWGKLRDLLRLMSYKDIPRIVLLTKIDQLSDELTTDVSEVFKNKEVKMNVDYVKEKLGIPHRNIMPIKNYENEIILNNSISCLALQALDRMLGYATDYLMKQNEHA